MKYLLVLVLAALVLPTAAQSVGSRDNPVPIGTSAVMCDNWEITVLSVVPNATEEDVCGSSGCFVLQRNHEEELFIARISAKYIGPGSDYFHSSYLSAVGSASIGYNAISNEDIYVNEPYYIPHQEVFTGGVITGIVVWMIPPAHANKPVMYDHFIDINKRTYMALY
jgi:hypothetical protein